MGGFKNAPNNKPQKNMRPALASYKQFSFGSEINAYKGAENSSNTATISRTIKSLVFESSRIQNHLVECNLIVLSLQL